MVAQQVTFGGDEKETTDLMQAVDHNCACTYDQQTGALEKRCEPHLMVISNQRAMDGLLFMRRKVDCLKAEEQRTNQKL